MILIHNLCWTYQSEVRIIWTEQDKCWWIQMFNFFLWIEITCYHWNKNEVTVFFSKWCWKEINYWKTPSRLSKYYQSEARYTDDWEDNKKKNFKLEVSSNTMFHPHLTTRINTQMISCENHLVWDAVQCTFTNSAYLFIV